MILQKLIILRKKLNFDIDYVVNFGGYVDHSNKKKKHTKVIMLDVKFD